MERATLYFKDCIGIVQQLRNGFFGMRVDALTGKGRNEACRWSVSGILPIGSR